jgi:hypothetical protein
MSILSPDFEQTFREDGSVDLRISTGSNKEMHYSASQLLPDDLYLKPEDITPTLIHMLARAFKLGWDEAIILSSSSVTNMTNHKDSIPLHDIHIHDYRKNKVKLVPIYDDVRKDYFVSANFIKPFNVYVDSRFDKDNPKIFRQVDTSYLKFGKSVSLLGISQNDILLESGIIDYTDRLDTLIALDKVVFSLDGEVITYDANFTKDNLLTSTDGRIFTLDKDIVFNKYFPENPQTYVEHRSIVHIRVDIVLADIVASISVISGYAEPLGYSMKANRCRGKL